MMMLMLANRRFPSGGTSGSLNRPNVLPLSCEPASHGDKTSGMAAAATNDRSAAHFAAAVTPSGPATIGGSAAGQPYAGSTAPAES